MKNISKIATEVMRIAIGPAPAVTPATDATHAQSMTSTKVDLSINPKNVTIVNRTIIKDSIKKRIQNQLKNVVGFDSITSFYPIIDIQIDVSYDSTATNERKIHQDIINKFKNVKFQI